jgi:hypothetical protein
MVKEGAGRKGVAFWIKSAVLRLRLAKPETHLRRRLEEEKTYGTFGKVS